MNDTIHSLLVLIIIYQVKHFLADFIFQNVYMLQKSRPNWNFVMPLAIHCSVHFAFSLCIILWVRPALWWLAIIDFVIHFVMDRIKAGPRYLGRYHDMRGKAFWVTFGLDQMVHHLTHLYICWALLFMP